MRVRRADTNPAGVWAPLLIALLLVLFDAYESPKTQYVGVLTAMPLLSAALTRPLLVSLVGATVTLMAFGLGFVQEQEGLDAATSQPQLIRLGFILAATVLGVVVSRARLRSSDRLRRLATVADAAQQAILRPLPAMVGPFYCASTYQSATTEASIGGDLVEVISTPFGVRVVVGDVRGKGMDAVRLAGRVLGSFREVGHTVPDLPTLARALDRAVRRDAGPEDFVTVLLVELDGSGRVTICACGHPAPYVVDPTSGPAIELETSPEPPLGLLGRSVRTTTTTLQRTQRLVLVTDGLLEARRPKRFWDRSSGQFFPAEEAIGASLGVGPMPKGLRELVTAVRRWTRGRLRDDMAVLVMQRH